MKRALNALPVLFLALFPLPAQAAASPSPNPSPTVQLSPTLDHVLVAPPAGYAAVAGSGNGHFTPHQWVQSLGAKSTEAERLLNQYGFVDGYQMTWASQATRHVITEFVVAFQGGKGAGQWFAYQKGVDTSNPQYQHADTLSGIPQYYGVHEMQSSVYGQAYLDGFVFVKGNDLIGVGYLALTDDNLTPATNLAKSQYAAAPASTIPPAQWPENANPAPASAAPAAASSGGFGKALPYALIIGAALVAIGLGAALVLTRVRRSAAAPALAAPAMPVAAAAMAPVAPMPVAPMPVAAAAVAPVTLPLQMSADGNFWYDGQRWVDVNQAAPPFAQRSPDGAFWWDGYNWRPVAAGQTPVNGR